MMLDNKGEITPRTQKVTLTAWRVMGVGSRRAAMGWGCQTDGTTEAPTLQSRNLGDEFRNHLVAAHDQTLQRLDVIGSAS